MSNSTHTAKIASVRTSQTRAPISPVQQSPSPGEGGLHMFSDLDLELKKFLYENQSLADFFENLEQNTSSKREYFAYGVIGFLTLYLIVGHSALLVSNLVGFVYPAYFSAFAMRKDDNNEHIEWLSYWIAFGGFAVLDFWAEDMMRVFPLYLLLKTAVLLYLVLPQTRGAAAFHSKIINPALKHIENYQMKPKSQ